MVGNYRLRPIKRRQPPFHIYNRWSNSAGTVDHQAEGKHSETDGQEEGGGDVLAVRDEEALVEVAALKQCFFSLRF